MKDRFESGRNQPAEVERMLRSAELQVQVVFRPLGAIGVAIMQAATNCRDAARKLIAREEGAESRDKEVYLFFEFIYFFMHMTLRKVHGRMSRSRLRLLQDFLLAMVPSAAIDSYFFDWREDLKRDMVDEFVERLDVTEVEYGTCTADGDFSLILTLFTRNLIQILGEGTDVLTLRPTLEAVAGELEAMQMEESVREFTQIDMSELDEKQMGEGLEKFRFGSS
ncbi:MAG TPA: hypothetical protein VGG45_05160 [Terracidiphilus sp.]